MAIDKSQKPTNLVPRSFGGEKNNFSEDLISNGYEVNVPQTYNGDNLNYQLDATGKELDYCEKVVDYINGLGVGKTPIVNANNKLDETQVGLKVYSATETYSLGEWVRSGDKIYQSLTQANLGNDLTNETYWKEVDFGGSGGYRPDLFDFKWADHVLNDIQWLRGDTFSWQSGSVYSACYNKLLSEWNDTNAKVLINADVIGTLTIADNGNVQGFSTTSYLTKTVDFSNGTKDTLFPMVFNFTTSTIVTGVQQNILDTNNFTYALFINTDGKLLLKLGSNGTSYNIANGSVGTTILSAATPYKVTLDYDGANYTLELTNLSTNTTTTEITVASTSLINTAETTISLGLDLDQTSILLALISVPSCSIGTVWHGTKGHKSSNGFIILDPAQEQWVFDTYNNTGVAWYYILDQTNHRFKLPRTKYGFVGLRDSVGNIVDIATSGTETKATQMYLYFYVGNYTQTAIEQTAGITSEQLNAKVDNSSLEEVKVVVETYNGGSSWYRVWSDGWIEQGGRGSRAFTNNATFTITFLKPFTNANNYLVFHGGSTVIAGVSAFGYELITRTTTSYTAKYSTQTGGSYTSEYDWYVCGY